VKIKVCGITNAADAHDAVEAGADALGFIFVPASLRYVTQDVASGIIQTLPPFVTPVGVFVDAARELIRATIESTGIRCLQLHGDETPEDTLGYRVPVYKSFRVGKDFPIDVMQPYKTSAYLLDTFVNGRHGGTGRTFDWNIAVKAKTMGRIILSGGLTSENVGDALATVRPYGVDVNSGVESSPGKKDKQKIYEFIHRVREVECSLS
jgi:phosphoribosylanthranilate isomerase